MNKKGRLAGRKLEGGAIFRRRKLIKDPKKPRQFVYIVQIKLQTWRFILFELSVLLMAENVDVCVCLEEMGVS